MLKPKSFMFLVVEDLFLSDSTLNSAIGLANSVWKACGKKPDPAIDPSEVEEDTVEAGFASFRAASTCKSDARRIAASPVLVSMIPVT